MTTVSPSAPVTAVLVDDSAPDRELAVLLSDGTLEVEAIAPYQDATETAKVVLEKLRGAEVGLALLDYRLEDGSDATYRGGSLAAMLRDSQPDLPIVLVTTESRLTDYVVHRPTVHALFDFQVLKERIGNDRDGAVANLLASIARGHRATHSALRPDLAPADVAARDWLASVIADLTGVRARSDLAREQLDLVLAVETHELNSSAPNEVARWIYQRLLVLPGALVDGPEAAAMLGVTLDSFDEARPSLVEHQYGGVFAGVADAWWYDGMLDVVAHLPAGERAPRLSSQFGLRLEVARCPWCGDVAVVRACSICSRATDDLHTVPVISDRPAWAAPSQVCFACILEGRAETHHVRYGTGVDELVAGIQNGEITPDEDSISNNQPVRERW